MKGLYWVKIAVSILAVLHISVSASAADVDITDKDQAQDGYRAFIDPNSGELTSFPPQQDVDKQLKLSPSELNAMSTSHQGLTQEYVSGKGTKLNLQGRFKSSTFATIDESGKAKLSHAQEGGQQLNPVQGENHE